MSKNAVMPLTDYVSACDSIREKTETTDLIKSGELAEKVDEVYEAGKKAEYDKFWDTYQKNGERADYQTAFWGEYWNDTNFKPKYDIVLNCPRSEYRNAQTFEYCGVENLQKILSDCGVSLITSGAEWLNTTFRYAKIKELDLDVSSCIKMSMSFYNLSNLISLSLHNLREDCVFDRAVTYCYKLENLSITGTIGTGSSDNNIFNVQYSPLTKESLLNIISCLKDFREIIVEDYSIPAKQQGYAFAEYSLVEGQKYSGYYQNPAYGYGYFEGVAQNMDIPVVGQTLAVKFEINDPLDNPQDVYIYNDNGNLCVFDTFDVSNERTISLLTITEKRTIALGTTNLNKLTDAEKAIATQKGWTLV